MHMLSRRVLNLFVTVKILEDTPAVTSLGRLCERSRVLLWNSGQKQISLITEENTMQYGKLRAHRCSGITNRTSQLDY